MLNYLFRRLNLLLITAFVLTIITFALNNWSADSSAVKAPYIIRYLEYLSAITQGEWGISAIDQQPILTKGLLAFSATLELCFIAFIIATVLAIPLGIVAGLNRNRSQDHIIMAIVLVGLALPVFWLAIICTMLPALTGLVLPAGGSIGDVFEVPSISGFLLIDALLAADTYHLDAFFNRLAHLMLPAAVLAFFLTAEMTRLTRDSITAVMKSNYIKAAYTKGLSSSQIVITHVLKNALPSVIHQLRLKLSTIISFAMVIEIVFAMNGAGDWLLTSIKAGDYIALPTAVLLISGFTLLTSIIIDIVLVIISPVKRKSLYVD